MNFFRILFFISVVIWLAGCGDIGGAGQCNGVEESGACYTVDEIQIWDPGNDEVTHSVDAFFNPDCNGDGVFDDPEPFYHHDARVLLSNTLMPGVTSPPAPDFVTWETYSIVFIPNPNNLYPSPPLTGYELAAGSVKVEVNTTQEVFWISVPIETKDEFLLGGGLEPVLYTAFYTIEGRTQTNEPIVLQGSTTFEIGPFNNCDS